MGQRRLIAERLQLMPLLGGVEGVAIGGPDSEDAEWATGRDQREVERRRAGQGRRAEAGELPVLEDPPGDAKLVRVHFIVAAAPEGEATAGIGQEYGQLAGEDLADVPDRDLQQLVDTPHAGQLPAHRVERRRALLALAGRLGLRPDTDGEPADHDGHHEHHGEGHAS